MTDIIIQILIAFFSASLFFLTMFGMINRLHRRNHTKDSTKSSVKSNYWDSYLYTGTYCVVFTTISYVIIYCFKNTISAWVWIFVPSLVGYISFLGNKFLSKRFKKTFYLLTESNRKVYQYFSYVSTIVTLASLGPEYKDALKYVIIAFASTLVNKIFTSLTSGKWESDFAKCNPNTINSGIVAVTLFMMMAMSIMFRNTFHIAITIIIAATLALMTNMVAFGTVKINEDKDKNKKQKKNKHA